MKARIYKPSKTAMQSGRAKTENWILEYVPEGRREPEPLMGWTKGDDTLTQVRMSFESREDAIAFAENNGLSYTVAVERKRKVQPRNYSDNFKYKSSEAV